MEEPAGVSFAVYQATKWIGAAAQALLPYRAHGISVAISQVDKEFPGGQ